MTTCYIMYIIARDESHIYTTGSLLDSSTHRRRVHGYFNYLEQRRRRRRRRRRRGCFVQTYNRLRGRTYYDVRILTRASIYYFGISPFDDLAAA